MVAGGLAIVCALILGAFAVAELVVEPRALRTERAPTPEELLEPLRIAAIFVVAALGFFGFGCLLCVLSWASLRALDQDEAERSDHARWS